MKSIISAATLVLLATTATLAQAVMPVAHARQVNQRARVRQGVATGELTRTEAARMKGREAVVRQDKRDARADGVVTRDERQDIRQEQNRTSRAIYRQKHDGQVR